MVLTGGGCETSGGVLQRLRREWRPVMVVVVLTGGDGSNLR